MPDTADLYKKYVSPAAPEPNITFHDRATYRYYNMDQVVALAPAEFEKFRSGI